jgi:hypothetical protein
MIFFHYFFVGLLEENQWAKIYLVTVTFRGLFIVALIDVFTSSKG